MKSRLLQKAVQQGKIFAMPEAAHEIVEIQIISRSAVSLTGVHIPR